MEEFDGGKIKMPRNLCMNAQISGHFLESRVQFVFISVSLYPRLALSVNAIIHA